MFVCWLMRVYGFQAFSMGGVVVVARDSLLLLLFLPYSLSCCCFNLQTL